MAKEVPELTENKELDIDQLQQKLKVETEKRVFLCRRELVAAMNPILDKHNCNLDISIVLKSGQVIPGWGVVPRLSK